MNAQKNVVKLDRPKQLMTEEAINGTWKLVYKTTNNLGVAGFSGRFLSSYPDAITGQDRHLENRNGQFVPGYFIQKIVTMLHPTSNREHRKVIDWLVGHPEVGVEVSQTKLSARYIEDKRSNPRIKLVNLDFEEIEDLEQEDFIDKLIGLLSLDTGAKSVGLKKLRYVLAQLNMTYREAKYLTQPVIEKQKLRKTLKTFVRSSLDNAKKVELILDNLDAAQFEFELKEMLRVGVLDISNGMYLYLGNPLGMSKESVRDYFSNNPDLKVELTEKLYNELKKE
tara:strand:- start:2758 stop:3600 length:843 start_codon:yes stop_codon:yes gene_type:complete